MFARALAPLAPIARPHARATKRVERARARVAITRRASDADGADAANEAADRANGDVQKQLSDAQVRPTQKFFTHRPVSTFDRFPFQLTGELFLYGMALRRRRGAG